MFRDRVLWLLLAVGLALRLVYGLAQDPLAPYGRTGGDEPWYLANSLALVTDMPPGTIVRGWPTDSSKLNQPPIFFLAAGTTQAILPPGPAIQALRILQALATTAVALFGFGLAVRLVGGLPGGRARLARRAGLLAAGALAVSPALIVESAQVKTESLYVCFVVGGVWAFVEAVARSRRTAPLAPHVQVRLHPSVPSPLHGEGMPNASSAPPFQVGEGAGGEVGLERGRGGAVGWWLVAGLLLGLATLTRAVFLVFPLALVAFTPFALGWRPGWKKALLLLAVYAAVVLSWTVYNFVRYQRLVLAGEGLASFVYLGATGWDGPNEVDNRLAETLGPAEDGSRDQTEFLNAASSSILADLPAYVTRRVRELGGGILQPHNVSVFSGESLRAIVTLWWTGQRPRTGPGALLESDLLFNGETVQAVVAGRWELARSLEGLAVLTQADAFWPKLLLYVVHYTGWLLGALGLVWTGRNWRVALPMLGFIGYVLLVHLILLALPRYLFPIMPFVWVFAASGVAVLIRKY